MILPLYFFTNFTECRGSHLTGFCVNPIRGQLAIVTALPSSLSSFWLYESINAQAVNSQFVRAASGGLAAVAAASGILFRKRGFILLRLLQIFFTATHNSKLGRSVLSTAISLISLGLFIPKYGRADTSSFTPAYAAIAPVGNLALSIAANATLTDTPFLYFATTGFFSKLKRFLFFYFTRLVAIPAIGQLNIFLWRGKLFDTENNLELFFFLGLRSEIIQDRKSIFYKIY